MIVLTAFTNYTKDVIYNFVDSLNKTGFDGRKIVAYYNPEKSIVNYLEKQGWEVLTYPKPKYYINFQRRKEFSDIIVEYNLQDEYICCADMRDVYFAKSPSDIKVDFYVQLDTNLTFENHEWNRKTIQKGYPEYYNKLKDKRPFCAGVTIGKGSILKEFFDDSYSTGLCSGFENIQDVTPGLDQSTFNLLLYTKYRFGWTSEGRYVLHMGNLDDNFNIDDYHIYHQYERRKKHQKYVDSLNKKSYI